MLENLKTMVAGTGIAILEDGGTVTISSAFEEVIEDIPSITDPSGFQVIARRRDSLSGETSANGDNVALNSTNNGELYVKHVDAIDVNVLSGGGGSGTEYTEGDIDATIMGNAIMMEVAGNTLQPVQGTVADGLLVNLGTNNDVTETNSTAILGATVDLVSDTDAIRISTGTIAGAVSGTEMQVDVITLPTIPAGTNYIGKVRLTDGSTDAEIIPTAGNNALAVGIVDAAGNQITSFGGGTEYTEGDTDAAITGSAVLMEAAADTLVPLQGTVADGLLVNLGSNNDTVPAGNVAHDAVDSGNPIKIGSISKTSLPTAVADADRSNAVSDTFGRILVSHIPHGSQVWKSHNSTTTQTGIAIWTPTAGKKVVITSIVIGTYGTTGARVILWFGASGDTTYTAGTDQLVVAASFVPDSFAKPGLVFTPTVPVFSTTVDDILRITTDAAISIDITVYGYEI